MQKSHIEEQLTTSERWCQLWSGNIPQKRILEGLVPQADPKLRSRHIDWLNDRQRMPPAGTSARELTRLE
jgi:hypothetical protein